MFTERLRLGPFEHNGGQMRPVEEPHAAQAPGHGQGRPAGGVEALAVLGEELPVHAQQAADQGQADDRRPWPCPASTRSGWRVLQRLRELFRW